MFCKNCGLEISSDAKFCPGCGTAVEDTEVKNEVAFSEKAEENTVSPDVTENQRPDTESSIGNKPDEAEKDTVQAQPIESYSEPEQNDNEVIESANESKQSEIAKSDFPATDNIKEVLLPQKGKNGKVKFKDLPKKQKIIRIAIGGGLLLIALIWMISDGISGAKKAGNPSTEPEKTGSASIKTIAYDNDTGAVFDMSLEEFSDLFSEIYINMLKEYAPDKEIKENWNIKDYWSNKVEPQTGYQETSGAKFTMYNAIIDRTIITVSVIDKRIDNVSTAKDAYLDLNLYGTAAQWSEEKVVEKDDYGRAIVVMRVKVPEYSVDGYVSAVVYINDGNWGYYYNGFKMLSGPSDEETIQEIKNSSYWNNPDFSN